MESAYGNLELMRTIGAGKFKESCLRLLDEVGSSGEPILITKRGRPVAQLGPVPAGRPAEWLGAMRDKGSIQGDLVAPAADSEEWKALDD